MYKSYNWVYEMYNSVLYYDDASDFSKHISNKLHILTYLQKTALLWGLFWL